MLSGFNIHPVRSLGIFLVFMGTVCLSACTGIEHRSEAVAKRALPPVGKTGCHPKLVWSNAPGNGVAGRDAKLNLAFTNDRIISADAKGQIYALNRETGAVVWQIKTDLPITSGPTIVRDKILVGTRDARIAAYGLENGAFLWQSMVSGEVLAAPNASQKAVYVNTLDGSMAALNLEDGQLMWRYSLNLPAIVLRQSSSPIVTERHVLGGFANGRLVALNRVDGTVEWDREVSIPKGRSDIQRMGDIAADPIVKNGVIYAVSYQGRLAALSLESGDPIWERDMSSYSGMALADNSLFVSDAKGHLWAVNRKTGQTLWEQPLLEGRCLTKPSVQGEHLVVGDSDGYLHWFSVRDGQYVTRVQVDGKGIEATPVLKDNALYAMGRGGKIVAYDVRALLAPSAAVAPLVPSTLPAPSKLPAEAPEAKLKKEAA